MTFTQVGSPLPDGITKRITQINDIGVTIGTDVATNIRNGPCDLFAFNVQKATSSLDASMKLYNNGGDGLVIGTTAPQIIFPCANGKTMTMLVYGDGLSFDEGLSVSADTLDGFAGTTVPDADADVWILTN